MLTTPQLPDDPATLKALLQNSLQREDELKQQIHSLLETLRLEKHRLYGTRSEKSPQQSELFDEADTVVDKAVVTDEADAAESTVSHQARQTKPSRKPLPANLPRVRNVIELSEEERQCPCGCTLVEIGEDISEQVDIVPAQVQVIAHVRKKYACKNCEDTVKTAARAEVLLPKSIASGNTLAYIITSKYADGLPLYRLSGILSRYGIELPRQTLSESVLKVAEKVQPLLEYFEQHLLSYPLQHMDETQVQVLNEPGKSAQSASYMWVQRGGPPDKPVLQFHYDPSRSTATAARLLSGYQGAVMTDGYKPYRTVAKANGLTHLCCWAHSRRKFVEAQKAQPKGKTGKADMAISFIAKLYAVEKQQKDSDADTRHRNRQQKSKAILAKFHTWLSKTQQQVPPKRAMMISGV